MHGMYAYIWLNFMVNVGKYTIRGSHGMSFNVFANDSIFVNLEDFPVHEGTCITKLTIGVDAISLKLIEFFLVRKGVTISS